MLSTLLVYGRGRDAAALTGYLQLRSPSVEPLALRVARLANLHDALILGAALTLAALIFHGPRVAAAVPILLLGAAFTTEFLKPLASNAHHGARIGASVVPASSWPSGHSTAAMALALAAVIAAPRSLRAVAAGAGAAFAAAVSFSLLILASHMPSDVIGGYLVAAIWAYAVLAALRLAAARWPPRRAGGQAARWQRQARWPLLAAVLFFGLLTVVIAVRHRAILSSVLDDALLLGVTALILASAAVLTTSVAVDAAVRPDPSAFKTGGLSGR